MDLPKPLSPTVRFIRHLDMNTLCGIFELVRLAWISRFRLKGPYWVWRTQTAFGRGVPADRVELLRSILEYGRWVHRMRRDMK